jgi:hypothetical protein
VLGPYSSGLSLIAATVAERYGKVLWNHGGASDSIYQHGFRSVVGILTSASWYFRGIIEMVRNDYPKAESVAIVYSTAGAFPKDVALGAEEYARKMGFDIVHRHPYAPRTQDFLPILRRLEEDRPGLILGVGRIEDDLRFAKQLHERSVPLQEVGLVAASIASFKNSLGSAAESFLGPSQWEPGGALDADYGPSPARVMKRLSTLRNRGWTTAWRRPTRVVWWPSGAWRRPAVSTIPSCDKPLNVWTSPPSTDASRSIPRRADRLDTPWLWSGGGEIRRWWSGSGGASDGELTERRAAGRSLVLS